MSEHYNVLILVAMFSYIPYSLAPPQPDVCSLPLRTAGNGSRVILGYCALTSPVQLHDLTFQWSKDGEMIETSNDGQSKYELNRGYLIVNNAQVSDSGRYQVNISNLWGSTVHTIQLEVTGHGESVLFSCFLCMHHDSIQMCS